MLGEEGDEALFAGDRLVLGSCNTGGDITGQEDRQAGVQCRDAGARSDL